MKEPGSAARADSEEWLDRVFHALSDPTRRALVRRLSAGPGKVTELAKPFDMSLNAISKHLKTLEKADLIKRDNAGRTSVCSLDAETLQHAQAWLDQYTRFWGETLDSLGRHMKRRTGPGRSRPAGRR
ncbi:MAG: helix-turn-helix transcriptional regulator [Inquilinus sp.]|nr:helix-turn-helix transcriptional regulator [Inquilinus sp.]